MQNERHVIRRAEEKGVRRNMMWWARRCEAMRGTGLASGRCECGRRALDRGNQASPARAKQASKQGKQHARREGERAGQGRKTNQGSTRLDWPGYAAVEPHNHTAQSQSRATRTKQKNQTTRSPARCRCHCASRADFWFGPVGQLDPRGATAQSLELVIGSRPLQGGPARVLYEYPSPNHSRHIFPRLINERHPDTASITPSRPTAAAAAAAACYCCMSQR